MHDRHARALTYPALIDMKAALDAAESPEDFLAAADDIIRRPENVLELPVDLGEAQQIAPTPGKSGVDVDNGPLVYEYLGAMDPANASDRRLWTYLAFGTYREYMEQRWAIGSVGNWKGRVEDRWLMLNATRGSLVRHGIARLWWVTSLTYDPKVEFPLSAASDDPFAYGRAVFRNEDRINALFDREAGALPPLVRAVLEHAAQAKEQATDGHIRALMKEVTLVYGYRDLGFLDADAIADLVKDLAHTH